MRSALYHHFGDPSNVLSLGDSPIPEPAINEVRIKTILAPIHNHDLSTIRGTYGYKPSLPAIGGSEAVGIIDAVGKKVKSLKVGQRVSVANAHNTWADYFIAPKHLVFPTPDSLSDEVAAQLIAMPLSALMLLEFLDLKYGEWVMHNAANGAVGKNLAILAKERGINTISIVRRAGAVDEMKKLGIENVVSTDDEDWQEQVLAITGKQPIAGAIDSIGGEAGGELLSLLGTGGTIVSFSALSGQPMALNAGQLIFKEAAAKGFWGTKTSVNMDIARKRRLINELIERATSGQLHLPVEATYDLSEVTKAVSKEVQSGKSGKILLKL